MNSLHLTSSRNQTLNYPERIRQHNVATTRVLAPEVSPQKSGARGIDCQW